jgi:ribose 5-phosphate isomerase A
VLDLNATGPLSLYVDGADECDPQRRLIKGGGAALTREKIIAEASRSSYASSTAASWCRCSGRFPVPIEVIPMARSLVARELVRLGGQPVWREGVVTDNGNWDLDVHNWQLTDPVAMEAQLNQLPGIVTVGLVRAPPADVVIVDGVENRP